MGTMEDMREDDAFTVDLNEVRLGFDYFGLIAKVAHIVFKRLGYEDQTKWWFGKSKMEASPFAVIQGGQVAFNHQTREAAAWPTCIVDGRGIESKLEVKILDSGKLLVVFDGYPISPLRDGDTYERVWGIVKAHLQERAKRDPVAGT